MPRVSFIVHTASSDDFLSVQGLPSYFLALTDNLRFQTLQDFELVYVDTYHEENKSRFGEIASLLPYPVKHVPLHPNHRYWFDKGYCYISAAKNTGILYADGQLCISCDDAEFFPDHLLELYWHYYVRTEGRMLMHALHRRMRSVSQCQGLLDNPVHSDTLYTNDHRWKSVVRTYEHPHGSLLFAGTSFALEDALRINGYNERMDGCKSLEDCDFGTRMGLLGRTFVMDDEGFLFILDHPNYADVDCGWHKEPGATFDGQETSLPSKPRRKIDNFIAVENYGMLMCATELMDMVANKGEMTPEHMRIIQRETIKYRQFDPLAPENAEKLAVWQGTPTFDLRQERADLRASADWRW
jgi:hypothetical protein